MVNNAFAFCSKEATLTTTGGMEFDVNKNVGPVSTIRRLLTSKDSDLPSYSDKNGESALDSDNPLTRILINNHAVQVNRGKVKGQLALQNIFGFCKSFKKITKNLGFHLIFKTNDLQDILFTTLADDINVTINSLYLYVPQLNPSTSTQVVLMNLI